VGPCGKVDRVGGSMTETRRLTAFMAIYVFGYALKETNDDRS